MYITYRIVDYTEEYLIIMYLTTIIIYSVSYFYCNINIISVIYMFCGNIVFSVRIFSQLYLLAYQYIVIMHFHFIDIFFVMCVHMG